MLGCGVERQEPSLQGLVASGQNSLAALVWSAIWRKWRRLQDGRPACLFPFISATMLTEGDDIRFIRQLEKELSVEDQKSRLRAIARRESERPARLSLWFIALVFLVSWLSAKLETPSYVALPVSDVYS